VVVGQPFEAVVVVAEVGTARVHLADGILHVDVQNSHRFGRCMPEDGLPCGHGHCDVEHKQGLAGPALPHERDDLARIDDVRDDRLRSVGDANAGTLCSAGSSSSYARCRVPGAEGLRRRCTDRSNSVVWYVDHGFTSDQSAVTHDASACESEESAVIEHAASRNELGL